MKIANFAKAIILIGLLSSPSLAQVQPLSGAALPSDIDLSKASAALIQTELNDVTSEIQRLNNTLDKWKMFSEELKEKAKRTDSDRENTARRVSDAVSKKSLLSGRDIKDEDKISISSDISSILSYLSISGRRMISFYEFAPQSNIVDFSINKEREKIDESIININASLNLAKMSNECASDGIIQIVPSSNSSSQKDEKGTGDEIESRYRACLVSLDLIINDGIIDKIYKRRAEIISSAANSVDNKIKDIESSLKSLSAKRISLINALQKSTALSDQLLTWAAPGLGIIVIILLIAPRCYSTEVQQTVFNTDVIIQLLTVFLLTTVILILGIAGKIPENALGTLLGGISGYVLGRTTSRPGNSNQ